MTTYSKIKSRIVAHQQAKRKVQRYVDNNTHYTIMLKREFMYIEDAQTAINLAVLEQRIETRNEIMAWLSSAPSSETLNERLESFNRLDTYRMNKLIPNFEASNPL